MGVVMGMSAGLLATLAALTGLILWTAVIFPVPTDAARSAVESRPGRCLGLGLLGALVIGVPAGVLSAGAHGGAKLAGWALFFLLGAFLAVGLAAMAQLLGERLRALSPGMTPLGGLVRGALTLEFALLLPFFGWFLFLPLVGLALIGAGGIGCLAARRARIAARRASIAPAFPPATALDLAPPRGEAAS
jgi:hypothetical protein